MGTSTETCQTFLFLCPQPSSLPSEGGLPGPTAPPHRRAAGEDELPADGRALLPPPRRLPPAGGTQLPVPAPAAGDHRVPSCRLEDDGRCPEILLQRSDGLTSTAEVGRSPQHFHQQASHQVGIYFHDVILALPVNRIYTGRSPWTCHCPAAAAASLTLEVWSSGTGRARLTQQVLPLI